MTRNFVAITAVYVGLTGAAPVAAQSSGQTISGMAGSVLCGELLRMSVEAGDAFVRGYVAARVDSSATGPSHADMARRNFVPVVVSCQASPNVTLADMLAQAYGIGL